MKIEKNIPIPVVKKPGPVSKYPFAQMDIGDSFLIDRPKNTMAAASYAFGKKTGTTFTVVSVEGGVRIWRTK